MLFIYFFKKERERERKKKKSEEEENEVKKRNLCDENGCWKTKRTAKFL